MPFFFSTRHAHLLLLAVFLATPVQLMAQAAPAEKKFDPPRIVAVIRPPDTGREATGQPDLSSFYYIINKGQESNLGTDDILNVYREKDMHSSLARPMRILIGTMTITDSQNGSSVGQFTANTSLNPAFVKYTNAMKGDIVMPLLTIDTSVLFDAGLANLKPNAGQEFAKVANFVQSFSPSKIIIEGHTDSDGDEASNQQLSETRAEMVRQFIINTYTFITPNMIEAKGYGERQPIVSNDTPENKMLNRRIEIVVWE